MAGAPSLRHGVAPDRDAAERLALATRFVIASRHDGRPGGDIEEVVIEKRGHDAWCIKWWSQVWTLEGTWEYEPLPSSRTDDFIAYTRFSFDEVWKQAPHAVANVAADMTPNLKLVAHV